VNDRARLLGFGAAACAACCAGPVLAFLGGLTLAGLASAVFVGGAGLVVATVAAAAFVVAVRRPGRTASHEPVRVAMPTVRTEGVEPSPRRTGT
jgi:hypothetical protein